MPSNEKLIEKYLCQVVRRLGGLAIKGNATNSRGFVDRIILLHDAKVGFIEIKGTGLKMTKLQAHIVKQLQGLGFHAGCADSKKMVDEFLKELQNKK